MPFCSNRIDLVDRSIDLCSDSFNLSLQSGPNDRTPHGITWAVLRKPRRKDAPPDDSEPMEVDEDRDNDAVEDDHADALDDDDERELDDWEDDAPNDDAVEQNKPKIYACPEPERKSGGP